MTAVSGFFVGLQLLPFFTAEGVARTAIAAGSTFFAYIVARGVIEGWVDSSRNDKGETLPSDVTSSPARPAPVEVFESINPTR